MEREVRYCTTEDGVNIAYCVEGEGPTTILALPALIETFSLDHLMPVYQQFYSDLGKGRRLIRLDWRNTGLSARIPDGANFDDHSADLAAVARSAAGHPCVVWAPTTAGPEAIEFTVAHPGLVSHLLLYGTFAASADAFSQPLTDAISSFMRADWQIAAQTVADMNGRREFPDEAAQLGDWYYSSVPSDYYLTRMERRASPPDASALLPQVQAPTLVLHRIADPAIPFSAGQKLAAGIPGARFVPLEGKGHLFCLGDYSRILASVDALLGDRPTAAPSAAAEPPAAGRGGDMATVLFTDLVGHTEMMSRLGDERGRAVLREHEAITREVLKQHGGTEVKTMGDGFMASFASVTKAVECAVALQRAFDARNRSETVDTGVGASHDSPLRASDPGPTPVEPLHVRVGLNAGEPIEEDGPDGRRDLFGATVILASRIAARAEGGEILVADTVRGLCSGKGFLFADRGEFTAKGFEDPVHVYEVNWRT